MCEGSRYEGSNNGETVHQENSDDEGSVGSDDDQPGDGQDWEPEDGLVEEKGRWRFYSNLLNKLILQWRRRSGKFYLQWTFKNAKDVAVTKNAGFRVGSRYFLNNWEFGLPSIVCGMHSAKERFLMFIYSLSKNPYCASPFEAYYLESDHAFYFQDIGRIAYIWLQYNFLSFQKDLMCM